MSLWSRTCIAALVVLGASGCLGERTLEFEDPVERDGDADMSAPRADMSDAPDPEPETDMGSPDQDMDPEPEPDMGEDPLVDDPTAATRYAPEALRSPMTASVVASMAEIRGATSAPEDAVFIKIGASGTVNRNFMTCFDGGAYTLNLDGREHLTQTIEHFSGSFERETEAAVVGRTARWSISGSPSPVAREIAAMNPRVALVNYGTNDMQQGTTYQSALFPFVDHFTDLLDELERQGIVPIITGLNPRSDRDDAAAWVPTYNAATRAIAEQRQLPYLNLYEAVRDLPSAGLVSDGIHGNTYRAGSRFEPCVFTGEGLGYNYNVRNLLTLETLHAVRDALLLGSPVLDAPALWQGAGTQDDPFVIDALPFTHSSNTADSPTSLIDEYPGCDANQNESGPELYYTLTLDAPATVRALVLDQGSVDVDLHVLGADKDPMGCVERDDKIVELELGAGTHTLVVDTFVSRSNGPRSGAYALVVVGP